MILTLRTDFDYVLMDLFSSRQKGESGLGKSTLINSLFLTDLYPERVIPGAAGETHTPADPSLRLLLKAFFIREALCNNL